MAAALTAPVAPAAPAAAIVSEAAVSTGVLKVEPNSFSLLIIYMFGCARFDRVLSRLESECASNYMASLGHEVKRKIHIASIKEVMMMIPDCVHPYFHQRNGCMFFHVPAEEVLFFSTAVIQASSSICLALSRRLSELPKDLPSVNDFCVSKKLMYLWYLLVDQVVCRYLNYLDKTSGGKTGSRLKKSMPEPKALAGELLKYDELRTFNLNQLRGASQLIRHIGESYFLDTSCYTKNISIEPVLLVRLFSVASKLIKNLMVQVLQSNDVFKQAKIKLDEQLRNKSKKERMFFYRDSGAAIAEAYATQWPPLGIFSEYIDSAEHLRSEEKAWEVEKASLTKRIELLQAQVIALKKALDVQAQNAKRFSDQMIELKERLTALSDPIKRIDELKSKLTAERAAQGALRDRLNESRLLLEATQAEVAELKRQLKQAANDKASGEKKIAHLEASVACERVQTEDAKETLVRIKKVNKDLKTRLAKLQAEYKKRMGRLRAEVSQLHIRLASFKPLSGDSAVIAKSELSADDRARVADILTRHPHLKCHLSNGIENGADIIFAMDFLLSNPFFTWLDLAAVGKTANAGGFYYPAGPNAVHDHDFHVSAQAGGVGSPADLLKAMTAHLLRQGYVDTCVAGASAERRFKAVKRAGFYQIIIYGPSTRPIEITFDAPGQAFVLPPDRKEPVAGCWLRRDIRTGEAYGLSVAESTVSLEDLRRLIGGKDISGLSYVIRHLLYDYACVLGMAGPIKNPKFMKPLVRVYLYYLIFCDDASLPEALKSARVKFFSTYVSHHSRLYAQALNDLKSNIGRVLSEIPSDTEDPIVKVVRGFVCSRLSGMGKAAILSTVARAGGASAEGAPDTALGRD